MTQSVTLPLTGAGDSTQEVALDINPLTGGAIQHVKQVYASPQSAIMVATALAPGINIDLDATVITALKTGQLIAADIGSSVPVRVDLQTVSGARVTRTSLYCETHWKTPGASFIELVAGGTNKFGVSVTNLSVYQTSDVRITLYWDEVEP